MWHVVQEVTKRLGWSTKVLLLIAQIPRVPSRAPLIKSRPLGPTNMADHRRASGLFVHDNHMRLQDSLPRGPHGRADDVLDTSEDTML